MNKFIVPHAMIVINYAGKKIKQLDKIKKIQK